MADAPEKRLTMHYLKSPAFRTIHVDGAIGAPRLGGGLHMALFSERPAIPTGIEFEVEDAQLGKEVARIGRRGLVRELEVDAIMDLKTAKLLADWLTKTIKRAEDAEAKRRGREEE